MQTTTQQTSDLHPTKTEWLYRLNDHITKGFNSKGLRFLGEVYASGSELVIHGQVAEVREIEFRFQPGWGQAADQVASLRIIRFNSLAGVPFEFFTRIERCLKEALETFLP